MPLRLQSLLSRALTLLSPCPLRAVVEQTIRAEGPITIERYMQIVLQHPAHGYYRKGDPLSEKRDFSTAPEVSQVFGEMLGVWCVDAWQRMGKPDPFILLELGPGRGTMMRDLLAFTESIDGFHKALRLWLYESSATLRDIQKQKLARFHPRHIDDLSQLDPLPLLFIANELFDNLPVRQFLKTEGGWQETLVGFEDGKLTLTHGKPTAFLPNSMAAAHLRFPKSGHVYEFSEMAQSLAARLALHARRYGGAGLIIDYGYTSPPGRGTLDGWHKSKATGILEKPGKTDVTADVDFIALARAAKQQAAQTILMNQREFLLNLGTNSRIEALKRGQPPRIQKKIDAAFDQLTSPSKMGELWKVLIVEGRMGR